MTRGILTVALNAAMGVSYRIDGFGVDKVNLAAHATRTAEGKANNVARVLAALGRPVTVTGFAAGHTGRFIKETLAGCGIRVAYEAVAGENRTCITVVDPAGGTLTELREPGPAVTPDDCERFLSLFRQLLPEAELVVLSGSLPPGCPPDFYRLLVGEAYRVGQVRTIVDAAGPVLREALAAQPYLVKPNLAELEEWAGARLETEGKVLLAAQRMLNAGPLVVAVSLGPGGLLLVSPEGAWRAVPPRVTEVNPVGSGDSLVAGLAAGLLQGLPAEEILRLAVACGTANAMTEAVATFGHELLEGILSEVTVKRLR